MCSPTSKKLCGSTSCNICFSRSFATHERAEFWSDKNEELPEEVFLNSNKKYWFECGDCEHEFETTPNRIGAGGWCKYCNHSALCDLYDCETCFEKSFASHPLVWAWSSRNTKTPREVIKGSEKKFWFKCKLCAHDFETVPICIKSDTFCPFCSNQRLCEDDDCIICFDKSCASIDDVVKSWSDKNTISPRMTFKYSNKRRYFNCLKCGHEMNIMPHKYISRELCCKYCSNQDLCLEDTCKICYNKSFASHEKVRCWSSKNTLNPRQVFKGAEAKYIFNCDKCYKEFESRMYNVLSGYWCPFCKNKTEGKLQEYLSNKYSTKHQARFDWCKSESSRKLKMPFDYCLEKQKILIELDGIQHFEIVSNWTPVEETIEKDIKKIKSALENGYSIIHIYQHDVWKDTYDWKELLEMYINILSQMKKSTCMFIGPKGIYKKHTESLNYNILLHEY
jgi:hypothetical protein